MYIRLSLILPICEAPEAIGRTNSKLVKACGDAETFTSSSSTTPTSSTSASPSTSASSSTESSATTLPISEK